MISNASLVSPIRVARSFKPAARAYDQSIFERVKAEVDLRKVLPEEPGQEEYDRYIKRSCINPDHPDKQPSMLVFADGCYCTACGFRADAVDVYSLFHPELTKYQCAEALLAGDYSLEGEATAAPRERRELDQDLAVRYHLELVRTPKAFDALLEFGFQREAIQHFQLGLARVLVRLQPEEVTPELQGVEWRDVKGNQVPFQRQWRFSIPVFRNGRLVQLLYRKAKPEDPGPKVTVERGAGAQLFNADALKGAETAVFCEGYGDAICFWQAGIIAVASTNGANHWTQEWAPLLGHVKRLYVVGDADDAGQKMVARVRADLPWARELELPWEHGTKKDIRDLWLAGWRRDDYLKLLAEADIRSRWRALKRR